MDKAKDRQQEYVSREKQETDFGFLAVLIGDLKSSVEDNRRAWIIGTVVGMVALVLAFLSFIGFGLELESWWPWAGRHTANEQVANRAAEAWLGRDLNTQGLDYWAGRVDRGGPNGLIKMMGEPESRAGSMSDGLFVASLYSVFMDRDPPSVAPDEWSYWLRRIWSGERRADVARAFLDQLPNG